MITKDILLKRYFLRLVGVSALLVYSYFNYSALASAKVIGATVGAVTTPILGSLSRGITQTVVDAQQYESWASNNVESWGWNDTKFGYASGLAVRGISTVVGGAVGLVHGIWAGGKQAYDNYSGEGVFKGAWQAISNVFYACEPTRFSNSSEQTKQRVVDNQPTFYRE